VHIFPFQKNKAQTIPTNRHSATYGSEDLPLHKATLPHPRESTARQALFSEKAPKKPENIQNFETITPVMNPVTPVMNLVTPVMKAITPVTKVVTPVMKTVTPVMKAVTPVMKVVTPVMKTVTPVMKVITPVMKVVTPVMKASSVFG
jgi:hypothetical protein